MQKVKCTCGTYWDVVFIDFPGYVAVRSMAPTILFDIDLDTYHARHKAFTEHPEIMSNNGHCCENLGPVLKKMLEEKLQAQKPALHDRIEVDGAIESHGVTGEPGWTKEEEEKYKGGE